MRLVLLAAFAASIARAAGVATQVTHVAPVAADILAVTIDTGEVALGNQVKPVASSASSPAGAGQSATVGP